jgi:5-methyltetrahydropteroyltriglutamate--homocysteine methyltransferase
LLLALPDATIVPEICDRSTPPMSDPEKPPFRADHVGSLLRPAELLAARARHQAGEVAAEALREVEDRCIREAVALQEEIGLQGITDGEFRRTYFHIDFLERIEGVAVRGGIATRFHRHDREIDFAPPRLEVVGKLRRLGPIAGADFDFLAAATRRTAKLCIPSPTMVHFRGGRASIDSRAYPDLEEFFADLARVYREEIADLAARGCRYLQLDDTNLAYLCDERLRQGARERGDDPDRLPLLYARLINESIRDRPPTMTVCIHLCRGNFRSAWVAEGGYDPVAEALFAAMDVDGYFLEFDTPRAGDFSPLRLLPKGKKLVLGLVTSKTPELEPVDALLRRIEAASRFVPLDQLAISPQCGFSSTVHGNEIDRAAQAAKLRLVIDVAARVWGD